MIWGSIPRGEEQRLYGDVQPPPAEQSPVPESQGPAVTNAVLAGGLGLHPKGPVPYQPGKHRRYQDGGVGAGTCRIYQAGAGP